MPRTPKQEHLFEGYDWATRRGTVAHAFDTLDKLQELCQCCANGTLPEDSEDQDESSPANFMPLLDELRAEIGMASADILASASKEPFLLAWRGFEMESLITQSRKKLRDEPEPSPLMCDQLFASFGKIKSALREMDS